jgi:hypothetical protein
MAERYKPCIVEIREFLELHDVGEKNTADVVMGICNLAADTCLCLEVFPFHKSNSQP